MRAGDWIQTFTGLRYWPLDPRLDEIDIRDIAHSLSLQCRYTGHCRRFYSVAEHSVLVSQLVSIESALAGLLHDAPEAYLTDVAKPVKSHLANYSAIEDTNWRAVACKFGVPVHLPEEVHEADRAMLLAEHKVLMPSTPEYLTGEPAHVKIECWHPELAEAMFLARFHGLVGRVF